MVKKNAGKAKTILIIDDDPVIVKLLKASLTKIGCAVLTAGTGQEGLAIVGSDFPDLIVLDVLLPDANGYEILTELKKDPVRKDIPVVMLTTKKFVEDIEKGLALGVDDFVTKPVQMGLFLKRVENLLSRK